MPNILQVPVPTQSPAQIWSSRQSGVNSLLFINQDLNNTVWVGQAQNITAAGANTIPIAPNGTFSGDASSPWYVIGNVAGTQPLVMVPNGQGYFLGLTQGLGKLAIPSIRSPNFVHNVSGWQIAKDGSAEFNNLTLRGTFFGTDFIIGSTGAFFYSGTPATGNLIATVTPLSGTDSFGNTYQAGINAYITASGVRYAMGLNQTGTSGEPGFSVQDIANVPNSPAGIFALASNGATKFARAVLASGLVTNTDTLASIVVHSATDSGVADGTAQINANITSIGNTPTVQVEDLNGLVVLTNPVASPAAPGIGSGIYANANGNPAWVSAVGQKGMIPATQGVQGGNTNNTTSMNAMFTPFSIPGGDAQNGTIYRIRCGGHGTQATGTAVALNWQLRAFGLNWGASTDTGNVAAGAAFHWDFEGTLIIGSNTSSAPASMFGKMTISQAVASASGHTTAMDTQVASGVDTTINQNITVQAGWASITGSPTLVCTGASFERMGA